MTVGYLDFVIYLLTGYFGLNCGIIGGTIFYGLVHHKNFGTERYNHYLKINSGYGVSLWARVGVAFVLIHLFLGSGVPVIYIAIVIAGCFAKPHLFTLFQIDKEERAIGKAEAQRIKQTEKKPRPKPQATPSREFNIDDVDLDIFDVDKKSTQERKSTPSPTPKPKQKRLERFGEKKR